MGDGENRGGKPGDGGPAGARAVKRGKRSASGATAKRRRWLAGRRAGTPFAVFRRRVTAELLDLACVGAEFLLSGGRSFLRPRFVTGNTLLDLAARRLAKSGLIVYHRSRGKPPLLTVTGQGRSQASELLWPERFWNRRWDGRWHLLSYDVPEKERGYRCALERFFRRQRMGCLQKSVWVSARDIRPLFDDLDLAAAIRDYAVLFEASPVLGQSPRQIAAQAWDFEGLARHHQAYLDEAARQPAHIARTLQPAAALAAARRELFDYLAAMESDPLLPAELLPDNYAGRRVVEAFRSRLRLLLRRLFAL